MAQDYSAPVESVLLEAGPVNADWLHRHALAHKAIEKALPAGASLVAATSAAGAATVTGYSLVITTEPLVTAANADYTLTVTDPSISPTSQVFVSRDNGSNTVEPLVQTKLHRTNGAFAVTFRNLAAVPLNGTIVVSARVF